MAAVSRFTKAISLLLLALWVPGTMHCLLETVPGFSFMQVCCGGDEASPATGECADDVCGEVESGSYRLEDHSVMAPVAAVFLAWEAWDWLGVPFAEHALQSQFLPASPGPHELPRSWQFHHRAALPPRAPSLA
jgi:hypothetical protein